jgi:class 3 adenylate cyclase
VCCRSRSAGNEKSAWWPRCSRLPTGSKRSAYPSTRSALPRAILTSPSFATLTDQDLKELGVSLGHRRKMLRAIAELAGIAPTSPQPALTEPKRQDTAERRQVTVMFSDLVGSTALSARIDPEDLREVISAYQKCVAETVNRVGGFVAKYMGDGVLVYFGYPQAHEDDAERAVRAGLALLEAVAALQSPVSLQTPLTSSRTARSSRVTVPFRARRLLA